ncbi:site-2 protease family protein [Thermodesulfobacteriota bacterium]
MLSFLDSVPESESQLMPWRKRYISKPWIISVSLFLATCVTTTLAGGWQFSLPLMAILLSHEMGHHVAGRLRFLIVTPPYFLPGPPLWPLPGTFGAFIKIRSPITNRKVLMEVGAWGPVAGALVAIPVLIIGLYFSEMRPGPVQPGPVSFGSSLLLEILCYIRFGSLTSDATILLHPAALAAWFGLFVTSMNLLPIGQLDGGHVVCALFGTRIARLVSMGSYLVLVPLGIIYWPGWFVFGVLALLLGLRHPDPLDPVAPLNPGARLLGYVAIIIFILTFVPVPITISEPVEEVSEILAGFMATIRG